MSLVVDADSHFRPLDIFDDEEGRSRFRNRWPQSFVDAIGRQTIIFPDRAKKLTPQQWALPGAFTPSRQPARGYWDSRTRVEWLDQAGYDIQVLVPGAIPALTYDVEPELALAVSRSHNNAISRVLKRHPGRFIGLAAVPMQDVLAAIDELDRAILELGLHAPFIFTNVQGRNINAHEFWPFYRRVEELRIPLIIHGNRFEGSGVVGMERLDHMHLDNALGFLFEGTLAITSLILYGVLDVFPRLRVGILETGAGYLTYLMDRLQEVYEGETYGGIAPNPGAKVREIILKPPEEYMNQFWVCINVACERKSIPGLVKRFGADRFLINSDYPHGLGGPGEKAVELVRSVEELTRTEQDRILGLNACDLFDLDPETRRQVRAL